MTSVYEPDIPFLVRRRFPDAKAIYRQLSAREGVLSPADEQTLEDIAAYETELSLKPLAEVQAFEEEEREKLRAEAQREEEERFYNQPYTDADFSYWSKLACWELDEAVALSFGKSPKAVSWGLICGYERSSRFVAKYARLRRLVERAECMEQLSAPILPASFIAWAKLHEIELPPDLVAAIEARVERVSSKQSRKQQPDLLPKERETVLKLIIGMAIKGYAYNPALARSEVPAEITSDVHKLGLSIDQDTVRKWLKEAAQVLPPSG
jgi:hypothetical protein